MVMIRFFQDFWDLAGHQSASDRYPTASPKVGRIMVRPAYLGRTLPAYKIVTKLSRGTVVPRST